VIDSAFNTPGEVFRQRPTQIGPAYVDPGKARTLHDRLEAAAHGFNFREFGHRVLIVKPSKGI